MSGTDNKPAALLVEELGGYTHPLSTGVAQQAQLPDLGSRSVDRIDFDPPARRRGGYYYPPAAVYCQRSKRYLVADELEGTQDLFAYIPLPAPAT